jgi:hypothetical protein
VLTPGFAPHFMTQMTQLSPSPSGWGFSLWRPQARLGQRLGLRQLSSERATCERSACTRPRLRPASARATLDKIVRCLGVDDGLETAVAFPTTPNMMDVPLVPILRPFGGDQLMTALTAGNPEVSDRYRRYRISLVSRPCTDAVYHQEALTNRSVCAKQACDQRFNVAAGSAMQTPK